MAMRWLLAVVLASLALAAPVHAATFQVTKTGDSLDGVCGIDCSLREAVAAANATEAGDEVLLPPGVARLTLFGVEDLNASGDIDITADLTIRGAGAAATTVQSVVSDRVFDLRGAGIDLALRDLTVSGGRPESPNDQGGGIRSADTGQLTLERVVVRDNTAQGAASFGYGGGVYKASGHLVVRESAILANRAVAPGYGGGIFLNLSMTTVELTNVTIAGNYAAGNGGGIFSNNAIAAALVHVTIAGNEAGSARGAIGGDADGFRLRSSIVAANAASSFPNCDEALNPASEGGNVGAALCGLDRPDDALALDPGLGPLGATAIPVREPLPGSPALDRAVGACPATDARGVPRPQGAACDAGAAELPVAPVAPLAPLAPVTPVAVTPVAAPRLGKLPKGLKLRRGKVLVPLRCDGARCDGSLKLTLVRQEKTRATGSATLILGRRSFSLAPGRKATVRVPLSARGRDATRDRKKVRARLTVRLDGAKARARTVLIRRSAKVAASG